MTHPAPPPQDEERLFPDLVPPGPRPRWFPGSILFLLSGAIGFVLMANLGHVRGGVVLGAMAWLIATLSLLDVLGSFDPLPEQAVVESQSSLGRNLVATVIGLAAFIVTVRLAVAGTLPGSKWTAALCVPATLIFTLVMLYRTIGSLGVFGEGREGALRHPSFWLLAMTIAIYAPMLGSFSLIDPWETHYGEVAREILSRDDWISLWWAQDGWFWSKPVLGFWLQALSFSLFDVGVAPDTLLGGVAQGRIPYPEWAARLPVLFCSLLGQSLLYAGVRRVWGWRAALLGSVVLVAVPYYALIVHQSMTDLPYIATLMGAMGLFILGLSADPAACSDGYAVLIGRRRFVVSAHALVVGAVLLLALPQIAYLLSRNLGLVTSGPDLGFYAHLDRFISGSGGGNCGLPGNEACTSQLPVHASPQPAGSAFFWSVLLAVFAYLNRGERRRQRLYFLAAWLLLALSFMAKGLPGPIIAIATLGAVLVITRRSHEFERLELPSGLLLGAVVALPWFVQMTVRHGPGFLERLFVHDMYKRAFVHVHDTNTGDDTSIGYYLWQLGYGLFPATGLLVWAGLGGFFGRGESKDRKQAVASMLGTWFLVGFAMFSLTLTKFHHYAIAIVPPICMLSGRYLAATLDAFPWRPQLRALLSGRVRNAAATTSAGIHGAAVEGTFAATSDPTDIAGTPRAEALSNTSANGEATSAIDAREGTGASNRRLARALNASANDVGTSASHPHERASVTGRRLLPTRPSHDPMDLPLRALFVIVAVGATWFIGVDLFTPKAPSGAVRLINLVTYNYNRPWPTHLTLDRPIYLVTLAAIFCLLGWLGNARLRSVAATSFLVTCLGFAAFTCNVYLPRIAPHWGQRDTIVEYYRRRSSPEELLVSFQMNWKGENFYTGNRTPAFITTGETFKSFIQKQRAANRKILFFTLEHGRVGNLRNELGKVARLDVLTDARLNNKFTLVRVEL